MDFVNFLSESSIVTYIVLFILSIYFIAINWLFIYRYFFILLPQIKPELETLENMITGNKTFALGSFSYNFLDKFKNSSNRETLNFSKLVAYRELSFGLTFLSVVATTSPFIGLFGTIFSILETFTLLGTGTGVSSIAVGIGEALFVTGVGIFVAIFAYTYHQLLSKKVQEIVAIMEMQYKSINLE